MSVKRHTYLKLAADYRTDVKLFTMYPPNEEDVPDVYTYVATMYGGQIVTGSVDMDDANFIFGNYEDLLDEILGEEGPHHKRPGAWDDAREKLFNLIVGDQPL